MPRVEQPSQRKLLSFGARRWLVDWRVPISAVLGFLLGGWLLGQLWRRQADWGDIPTWLGLAAAAVAGFVALRQLRQQQDEIAKAAEEAAERAEERLRQQAEDVDVQVRAGSTEVVVDVNNNSRRPIRNVTCRIQSRVDDASLVRVRVYYPPWPIGGRIPVTESGTEARVVRAKWMTAFSASTPRTADVLAVVWFTDDAGLRWQLDEDMHLVRAAEGDEFVPDPESRLPYRRQ